MKSMYKYCLVIFMSVMFSVAVAAQDDIHVGNDGPVIITLTEDAGSVIVGNPTNAYVVLDTPRRLMVNAGVPGMTRLTILNRDGKIIFGRNLIVGAGGNGVIRIQNACINANGTQCVSEQTFDCKPGQRCNRVRPNPPPNVNGSGEIQGNYSAPPSDTSAIESNDDE
jgi:hypothetical protein